MEKLGIWLVIWGVGSALIQPLGYDLKILTWVEIWGPDVAWMIRGALVVIGGLLFWLGSRNRKAAPTSGAPA